MANQQMLAPAEIAEYTINLAQVKASSPTGKLLALGIIAGIYIGFAANGSSYAAFNLLLSPETLGLGRFVLGTLFPAGLMLIVVSGGELFTGNCLMVMGVAEKKITLQAMLRNWALVYFGNLLGAVFVAFIAYYGGMFNHGANAFGALTIRIAASKTEMLFTKAFALGILCNILVCGTVWMIYGAKDVTGKLLACFFPIFLFAVSGYEHSVANMFYIPAGLFAALDPALVAASGVASSTLANLTWGNFFIRNLLPVTLGNIVGGSFVVGGIYWLSYVRKAPDA